MKANKANQKQEEHKRGGGGVGEGFHCGEDSFFQSEISPSLNLRWGTGTKTPRGVGSGNGRENGNGTSPKQVNPSLNLRWGYRNKNPGVGSENESV